MVLSALMCIALTPVILSADTTRHTDVIRDLMTDDTFDIADYPVVAKDYSLDVIQIAEGSDKSLFVYVYSPSGDRVATKLRMSVTMGKDYSPKEYSLKELSYKGTLTKYVVEGYMVSTESKRYYDIVAIFRSWDSSIGDNASGNDNTISQVSYKVGKNYTVVDTVDGGIEYYCNDVEVIEITDKWCGSIRYNEGFHLYSKKCDSWFVAFDTDRRIDKLIEADVEYRYRSVNASGSHFVDTKYTYGQWKDGKETPKAIDVVSNDADGLFSKKYEWNRIEKVSDFIAKESLTDDCKKNIEGKQWVLRFFESEYSSFSFGDVSGNWTKEYTEVSDVTILRLNFETLGKVYNLGVVDNYQSPDNKPDNNNDNEYANPFDDIKDWFDKFKDWWNNVMSSIRISLSVVGIVVAVTVISFVLTLIVKFINAVINLFRKGKRGR